MDRYVPLVSLSFLNQVIAQSHACQLSADIHMTLFVFHPGLAIIWSSSIQKNWYTRRVGIAGVYAAAGTVTSYFVILHGLSRVLVLVASTD